VAQIKKTKKKPKKPKNPTHMHTQNLWSQPDEFLWSYLCRAYSLWQGGVILLQWIIWEFNHCFQSTYYSQ